VTLYDENVELYDIAFDWDVTDEVDWLLERFGRGCASVLEPGCGSRRMLEAFARRGIEIVGIDRSPAMVAFARRRVAVAGLTARVVVADMTEFDLGRTFGAAVCPINTLGHLDEDGLARHLGCVARQLEPGACYLVQVGIVSLGAEPGGSHWETERGGVALRIDWDGVRRDYSAGREEQRSRIEILSGPRQGEVVEELHMMTMWTPATWRAAIAASPFVEVATYDGNVRERPQVDADADGGLLWHELAVA
jgi:SAM-dependent methyltransferase